LSSVGIAPAKVVLVVENNLTKLKIMKLIQCERLGLVGLNFGRLANLQDELDRLFESPRSNWLPA
jgi:hypothetical protein